MSHIVPIIDEAFGAGGIVLSKGRVLLLDSRLPQGGLHETEGLRECALRQVKEQAGFDCEIHDYFGSHVYSTSGTTHRHFFWVMSIKSAGSVTGGSSEHNDFGIDFVKVQEVSARLLTQEDKAFFQRHVGRIQQKN